MTEMPSIRKDNLSYSLTKRQATILFVFYSALIIAGLALSIVSLFLVAKNDLINEALLLWTVIASMAAAGMTSSIQYIKRLYKACITERVKNPRLQEETGHIGNMVYFLTRPLFAFVFTLVAIVILQSGFLLVINPESTIVNERFFYLSYIIACIIGMSVGRVLDKFKVVSDKKVDDVSGHF